MNGFNAAALRLMAAVTLELASVVSVIALVRFKINSTWLVLAGAIVGLIHASLSGAVR